LIIKRLLVLEEALDWAICAGRIARNQCRLRHRLVDPFVNQIYNIHVNSSPDFAAEHIHRLLDDIYTNAPKGQPSALVDRASAQSFVISLL
jgi:hypothetical protein